MQNALKLTYSNVAVQIFSGEKPSYPRTKRVSNAAMKGEGRMKEGDGRSIPSNENQPPHYDAVISKIDRISCTNPSASKFWYLSPKRSKTHLNWHLSFQTIFHGLQGTPSLWWEGNEKERKREGIMESKHSLKYALFVQMLSWNFYSIAYTILAKL